MSHGSLCLWSTLTLHSLWTHGNLSSAGHQQVGAYILYNMCLLSFVSVTDWLQRIMVGWRLGNAWNVSPFPFCWWFIWSGAFHKPIKREGMQAYAALWKDAFRSNSQKLVAERRRSCRGMLLFYQSVVSKWRLSGGWFRGHSADSGICVYDVWLETYLARLCFY